jgi:hypothetical protein
MSKKYNKYSFEKFIYHMQQVAPELWRIKIFAKQDS